MENNLLSLLTQMMGGQNQNKSQASNPMISSYPPEAFSQNSEHSQQGGENNFLPMLLSLLGKNPSMLSEILGQKGANKKDGESPHPKNEILL